MKHGLRPVARGAHAIRNAALVLAMPPPPGRGVAFPVGSLVLSYLAAISAGADVPLAR